MRLVRPATFANSKSRATGYHYLGTFSNELGSSEVEDCRCLHSSISSKRNKPGEAQLSHLQGSSGYRHKQVLLLVFKALLGAGFKGFNPFPFIWSDLSVSIFKLTRLKYAALPICAVRSFIGGPSSHSNHALLGYKLSNYSRHDHGMTMRQLV